MEFVKTDITSLKLPVVYSTDMKGSVSVHILGVDVSSVIQQILNMLDQTVLACLKLVISVKINTFKVPDVIPG
jgi:hypothetical protein